MTAEIKFTVDQSGEPIIEIKTNPGHHSIEQKLLSVFCEKARTKGISVEGWGFEEDGKGHYQIRIKNETP